MNKDTYENLLNIIKEKLKKTGWSQLRLSVESGVCNSSIQRILSGKIKASINNTQKICKALDIKI